MNNRDALITASAIRHIIRSRYKTPTPLLIEELWSEIATADTYGNSEQLFVAAIRESETKGTGDYWFKRVRKLVLAGTREAV